MEPDFSGWATKANLKCSDGRTIMPDAFKHQDQVEVPLVWRHQSKDVENILGKVILHNRPEGVYCDAYFNDTVKGQAAKKIVKHKDIKHLSIWANQLVERAKQVFHGVINEVSLVPAGANPGALIDFVAIEHADGEVTTAADEAIIHTGLEIVLSHEDAPEDGELQQEDKNEASDDKTPQEIYDSLTDEQKTVVHNMLGAALEEGAEESDNSAEHSEEIIEGDLAHQEGNDQMTRNQFDRTDDKSGKGPEEGRRYLSHAEVEEIKENWKRGGSMKHAVEEFGLKHGIENLELLFPDPKLVGNVEFDKRRTEWVDGVINGTRKSPFARIKTMLADITFEAARARGYIKGNLKKEEWFGLTKRTTSPTTIYKKQKLDRDDVIDATDLDIIAFMKAEMRMMLMEEIARAILIGDGRPVEDPDNVGEPNPDKIKDPQGAVDGVGIRSILHDDELYAATWTVNIDDASSSYREVVEQIMFAMDEYKGSGSPTFYTTRRNITKMLLTKDDFGRRLWRNKEELASEMGVSNIVDVEVFEDEPDLLGIIVNLSDFNVGTDKGGEVTLFDDFDLDYNQLKWLIETRFSGALVKIRSAIVLRKTAGANVLRTPVALAFDPETNTIDYVAQTGVVFSLTDGGVALAADVVITEDTVVYARPAAGSYFENNVDDEFYYEYQA